MLLKGKRILLGLCGGIAAYKSLSLIRLLKKEGAEVRCVCTPAALEFVTPLSVEALSGNRLYSDMFARENEFSTAHISYAEWADFLLVAPATANTLAKFAHGIADNALTTLFNAYGKKTLVVPAMNSGMYRHPATQENLDRLRAWGVAVMPPASGFLACGTQGEGRMPEPEEILRHFLKVFFETGFEESTLNGKHVLLTAGPTQEALDPVRYLSNPSTGLMGCCIADEFQKRGAKVHLVCGPMSARPKSEPFETVQVASALQMYEACMELWPKADIGILSAAVADYTPESVSSQKIKKTDADLHLKLIRTHDILKELGLNKRPGQYLAGFALETENEMAHARAKLTAKNADLIVLNSLRDAGAGFGTPTNRVCLLGRNGDIVPQELQDKEEVAARIADYIETKLTK